MDARRALALVRSTLDPRAYVGLFRSCTGTTARTSASAGSLTCGQGVRLLADGLVLRTRERIAIGDRTRIGDHVLPVGRRSRRPHHDRQ